MHITKLFKTTKLLKLTLMLSSVAVLAVSITVTALYKIALKQEGQLLTESVSNQIMLIRAISQQSKQDKATRTKLIHKTIKHLQLMNQNANKNGQSVEFVVAQRKAQQIIFLLWGKQTNSDSNHFVVPFKLGIAEPMRRALLGKSGVYLGVDHKGKKILAAYQYMPEYKLGLVEKIPAEKILNPYLLAILIASVIAIIFVFIGAYIFATSIRVFYLKDEIRTERLRKQHKIMSQLAEKSDITPCEMQMIFEDIAKASCEGLNVSRVGIWLFDNNCSHLHCADLYDLATDSHIICDTQSITDHPIYFRILLKNRVIDSSNTYTDGRTQELLNNYLKPNNIRAMLNATIRLNNQFIGVVCHEQQSTKRNWSQEDINFTCSITDYIAIAISNCRRNKAEQYLQESEERYQLAVAGSNDVLWDWDIIKNRVYHSPQYEKLLGYQPGNMDSYEAWLTYLHPDDKQRAEDAMDAHLKNAGTAYNVEYRIQAKSGDYRWFRARGAALRDDNGKPYRVSGSITDINDLKKTQYKLNRFKQTLGEVSEYIFMFDPETLMFFYANTSAINSLGYSEAELMQLTLPDIMPEYNQKSFRQLVSALITKPEETLNFESLQQHKNGNQVTVEIHLQYIAPDNTPPRFVAIVRDISARRATEIETYIQRTMLEHIYTVQEKFISGKNRQAVFEQLLNGIIDITKSEFGLIGNIIYTLDRAPRLHIRHITNISWDAEVASCYNPKTPASPKISKLDNLLGAVISTGETLISNDPANDPRAGTLSETCSALRSFMGLPLRLGDKLIGIVGIANRDEGYDDKLFNQLKPLLSTCSNLLDAENTEALRKTTEEALRHSEEKANTVLATVADGIITIDNKGLIESFNQAAEKIFGYSTTEVIGNNVNMLMPEPYKNNHNGYLQRYQQSRKAAFIVGDSREVQGKRKDGTIFAMELSVNKIHDDKTLGYTGIIRDITNRKQVETALIAAKDEAEKANRTKSKFLSSMSHELRTPLNAIIGFSQLLQFDTNLSGQQKKQINTIYSASNLLLDLINDVLDLTKIEAGHVELLIDNIELEPVVKDCFKLIGSLAEKKGIKLSYANDGNNINSCKNLWVRADNTRIRQILLNLLSNAVKYNDEGGTVYVCCPPPPLGFHRIRIIDTGRGINEQNKKNLFQPFNRLDAQHSDIEGTGIGLVITRKLVELMGGTINVESEYGKGSSFIIDLPVADAIVDMNGRQKADEERRPAISKKQYRILAAEDNPTNQELLTLQLDTLGYSSDVVANGKEAIEKLRKQDYDMLLTDIHMPEMDGYQLTYAVRNSRDSRFKNIIIIAITADVTTSETLRCIEAGMNDHLSKPVDINELQHKLEQWLTTVKNTTEDTCSEITTEATAPHKTTTIKAGSVATSKSEASTIDIIDTAMLVRYIGSDPNKHRRFFTLFLDTAPGTILAIHRAHTDCCCDDIKAACHKIKSSARSIGAVQLATLCERTEAAATDADWASINETIPKIDVAMSEVARYYYTQLAEKEAQPLQFSFDDVLIVDDDRFVLDLITLRLNSIGISQIDTAASGEEALAHIKNSPMPPSVLLLDLNMPGMDGVEFLRHLSNQSYPGNIILISAEDTRLIHSAESVARDRKLNILGALEKPVTITPLTELLLQVGTQSIAQPQHNKIALTESELRNAIDKDEFVVYYQPQIDIASKQLIGVEALIRWIHPTRGLVPPDTFIPLVEELKLINEVTDIVLHKAMTQCTRWREQGLDINLSVNISVDSLDRLDLPEYIVNCTQQHQLNISKLTLEITESRLIQDLTLALDVLTRLSLKGIGLSIDDFGTGYSSMEQLQRIPFSELKTDHTFVKRALTDKAARVILESSVELAQKLNMSVVAEGVENKACMSMITRLGYTAAQGYYIAKPMPGEELMHWHETWKAKNKPGYAIKEPLINSE